MYLTVADVCLRFRICRATLYRLLDGTDFPRPIRVGRQLRWRVADLVEWETSQHDSHDENLTEKEDVR